MKSVVGMGLSLAAAPTFALMAVISAMGDVGSSSMACSMHNSGLTGMVSMYALMSAFHIRPWLNLVVGRRREVRAA